MGSPDAGLLARLDAVRSRLAVQGDRGTPPPPPGLTQPDPGSGERWDAGQVWAHVAEFIPYWTAEVRRVAKGPGVVSFGRIQSDPQRIAAIESGRHRRLGSLWPGIEADLDALGNFIAGWAASTEGSARGRHQTLGEMDIETIVEEFLISHLESHTEQLEGLAGDPDH